MSTHVALVNPLPIALHHYQRSLQHTLASISIDSQVCATESAELGGEAPISKLRRAAALVRDRRRVSALSASETLVLWPAFGSLESLSWPRSSSVTVIWHDPRPLRKTHFSGKLSDYAGALRQRHSQISFLAHTEEARRDIEEMGFSVRAVVEHPYLDVPLLKRRDDTPRVLVAGQYKPVRDLSLMRALGTELRSAGYIPEIVGRGWPAVDGWDVRSEFVSEEALQGLLSESRVVILPYSRVYQSGIAIRAAELGTPVVGPRTSNVAAIFGDDWRGCVDDSTPQAWLEAIDHAVRTPAAEVDDRIRAWKARVRTSWRALLPE
ncbi:glycosyltransferase family protein [Microbacterium aureliae]